METTLSPQAVGNVQRMVAPHFFTALLEPLTQTQGSIEIAGVDTDLLVGHIEVSPVIKQPLPEDILDKNNLTHRELLEAYQSRQLINHPDLPPNTRILVKAYQLPDETYVQPLDGQNLMQPGRYLCTTAGIVGIIQDDDPDTTELG